MLPTIFMNRTFIQLKMKVEHLIYVRAKKVYNRRNAFFEESGPMHMTVERVSYLHESEIDELMNEIKHSLTSR